MISTFFGLDVALRALQAQQAGMDVTNHNVANANTEGFSRQNVRIVATDPFTVPGMNRAVTAGQMGTGALAKNIQRARDAFIDSQYRTELGGQKNAAARQDALEQVEVVLDEPQGVGVSSLLNEYYRVLSELSGDPSDLPTRTTVVQQAVSLTQAFNRISTQLNNIRTGLDGEAVSNVADINDITDQILQLNQVIVQVEVTGQAANDFRDRRDLLVDRLSELVQTSVSENTDGSINVLIGAQVLVNGATSKTDLFAVPNAGNNGYVDVTYGSGGPAATLGKAAMSGLLSARDTSVPNYLSQLNAMAGNLITATNQYHTAGFDLNGNAGQAFFTGTNAATIGVNAAIVADPRLIAAASAANAPGNNSVVLQIMGLRNSMSPPLAGRHADLAERVQHAHRRAGQREPHGSQRGRDPGQPGDPARTAATGPLRRLAGRGSGQHGALPAGL